MKIEDVRWLPHKPGGAELIPACLCGLKALAWTALASVFDHEDRDLGVFEVFRGTCSDPECLFRTGVHRSWSCVVAEYESFL